jgi:hypothetical protein
MQTIIFDFLDKAGLNPVYHFLKYTNTQISAIGATHTLLEQPPSHHNC